MTMVNKYLMSDINMRRDLGNLEETVFKIKFKELCKVLAGA